MRKQTSDSRGFTLVELVVVLLVVAILSVFVAQKMGNVTSMKAAAFVKKVRADIRYAQNVAMARNRRSRVYFNGAGGGAPAAGYAVVIDGAAGLCNAFAAVDNPDRSGNLTVALGVEPYAGITINPGSTCLEFNSLGSPFVCSGGLGVCDGAAAPLVTITVPEAPVAVRTITVAAGTGAVN